MKRLSALLLSALLAGQAAYAAPAPVKFDGKTFGKEFVGVMEHGNRLKEYVANGESFENWSKLIGIRYQEMPQLNNDPAAMAKALAVTLRQNNPQAKFEITHNPQQNVAVIDFITWKTGAANDGTMEINAFKYWQSADKKGLYSLQLAQRVRTADYKDQQKAVQALKNIRSSLLKQIRSANHQAVEKALQR